MQTTPPELPRQFRVPPSAAPVAEGLQASPPPAGERPRRRRLVKYTSLLLGFFLGIAVWHLIGFWQFVTAVTLTGQVPANGNITTMILAPEASTEIAAPKPQPAQRKPSNTVPQASIVPTGAATPERTANPTTAAMPAALAVDQPVSRTPGSRPARSEPSVPQLGQHAERQPIAQPSDPQPPQQPAWATRIITGATN